jgi:AmmeMemoRadiSam system protein B
MNSIRPAAVAGAFYPSEFDELSALVTRFLREAQAQIPFDAPAPKAIVAPHAGYIYSGANAALAYARLNPAAKTINSVILMGPCHRVALKGVALSSAHTFATPLGKFLSTAKER